MLRRLERDERRCGAVRAFSSSELWLRKACRPGQGHEQPLEAHIPLSRARRAHNDFAVSRWTSPALPSLFLLLDLRHGLVPHRLPRQCRRRAQLDQVQECDRGA